MATFYVSSTYVDLKDCRERVTTALRKAGHEVVGMENYTASGAAPPDKCLADVASCEGYIGIFAWRYGHVPQEKKWKRKSITELEYLKAVDSGLEPLIFILNEDAPWSPKLMDKDLATITRLRKALASNHVVAEFTGAADLATAVLTAVAGYSPKKSSSRALNTADQQNNSSPASARPFWKRHPRTSMGTIGFLVLVLGLIGALVIHRRAVAKAKSLPPVEHRNPWAARFTKAEKIDEHWSYPRSSWTTEPGDSVGAHADDEALVVRGQQMGIPNDLNGEVFYDFRANFKVRFENGATHGAWVLRAQPDKLGGYLFELAKEGSELHLKFWIYEAGSKKGNPLESPVLPFPDLNQSNALTVDVIVKGNRFTYSITFEDDHPESNPHAGDEVNAEFQDDPANVRWPWGTVGFLSTDDTSAMRVEYIFVYPQPKA